MAIAESRTHIPEGLKKLLRDQMRSYFRHLPHVPIKRSSIKFHLSYPHLHKYIRQVYRGIRFAHRNYRFWSAPATSISTLLFLSIE
jgi:hypothetical protein